MKAWGSSGWGCWGRGRDRDEPGLGGSSGIGSISRCLALSALLLRLGGGIFCSYFILRKLSGLSIRVNELLCINLQMFSCISARNRGELFRSCCSASASRVFVRSSLLLTSPVSDRSSTGTDRQVPRGPCVLRAGTILWGAGRLPGKRCFAKPPAKSGCGPCPRGSARCLFRLPLGLSPPTVFSS